MARKQRKLAGSTLPRPLAPLLLAALLPGGAEGPGLRPKSHPQGGGPQGGRQQWAPKNPQFYCVICEEAWTQFPQALCQSRGPARAGRCPDRAIPAIPASDRPMAGGLPWQACDGELREHGSWRPGILSRRIEVRKSTSGAAACSVTERWRCGRSSRRASIMPILSRRGSTDIRHDIAQERQG